VQVYFLNDLPSFFFVFVREFYYRYIIAMLVSLNTIHIMTQKSICIFSTVLDVARKSADLR
jgi:hypothetical protein